MLASLCAFAGRLYLLRTGAGSRSAAAFTAQVRVGGPWLLIQSPKFSRGPHLCPRTSSATWHLSLDESGPFFVQRRTRLPATPHSACCWATMRWRIAAPIIPYCEMCVFFFFSSFGQIQGQVQIVNRLLCCCNTLQLEMHSRQHLVFTDVSVSLSVTQSSLIWCKVHCI